MCGFGYALVYTVLICSWPALPTQDTPLWTYEAELLRSTWHGLAADGCRMVSALPPNALAQGVLALLMEWVSADTAARIYLSACVCTLVAALVYLCRARDPEGRSAAVLALLPMCAGYPLFHGFLNYLAALPVLAFGMGTLLRDPEGRGARGLCVLVVLPTLTYLCHGVALGVWGVIVLVQLCIARSGRFALRAAAGFVPVLVLLLLYIAQRSTEGASVTWSAGSFWATVLYRLRSPLRFFSVFQGLTPTFDDPSLRAFAPLYVSLNGLYAVGLSLGCVVWAVLARRSARLLSFTVLALAGSFVLMPHDVARMLNPAERLLFPMACFGAAGMCGTAAETRRHQLLRRAALVLILAQGSYMAYFGTRAAYAAARVAQAREQYSAPSVQAQDVRGVQLPERSGWVALLTRHQVLAMQGLLEAVHAGRELPTPFPTGLFRCERGKGPAHDLEGLLQGEQNLILLGEHAELDALFSALATAYRVIEKGPGFAVLQPSAAAGAAR